MQFDALPCLCIYIYIHWSCCFLVAIWYIAYLIVFFIVAQYNYCGISNCWQLAWFINSWFWLATRNQNSMSLGNLQKIGEFPSQMASNMERVFMSWHHHGNHMFHHFCPIASGSETNYPDSKVHGGQHGGPSGAGRTQVGPMLAPWSLLSGYLIIIRYELCPVTANRPFAHIPQYTIL